MNETSIAKLDLTDAVLAERLLRLGNELRFAWHHTSPKDLQSWGLGVSKDLVWSASRRVKNVTVLIRDVGTFLYTESSKTVAAAASGRLKEHALDRRRSAAVSVKTQYNRMSDFVTNVKNAFQQNPQEAAVQLTTLVITSLLVSGGPDGNGGAPDLDLAFGIDAHRSFFSHSILMGAALETGILALLKLVQLTHEKLPTQHDPLWDKLHHNANGIALSAAQGASIGMAYHLLVDGLAQPAAYHDLPVSMPMEAHQTVFVANGLGEVIDVRNKKQLSDQL